MPIPRPMRVIQGEDNTDRWKAFPGAFLDYAIVDKLFQESPVIQMAKFRAIFGEDNRQLVENLDIGPIANDQADDTGRTSCQQLSRTMETLGKKFQTHRKVLYQRFILYRSRQEPTETTKDFLQRLNKQLKKCDFGIESKTILRDMLVLGTRHSKTQEACFREELNKLDTQRASQIIEMYEDNEKSLKHIAQQRNEPEESANVINSRNQRRSTRNERSNCRYCGRSHQAGKCPAFGKTCTKCQKKDHFASVCRSANQRRSSRPRVNMIQEEELEEENDANGYETDPEEDIYTTRTMQQARKIFTTLHIPSMNSGGDSTIRALMDTGATVNVISMPTIEKLKARDAKISDLDRSKQVTLNMYDYSSTRTAGQVKIQIRDRNRLRQLRFQVVSDHADTLISAQTCLDLGLIRLSPTVECVNQVSDDHHQRLIKLKEQHENIFVGLGRLPGKVKIHLKTNSIPVQQPPRRTPVALTEPLIQRIKEMERAGLTERVDHPTKWVNNIVPVHREGKKLRICLDPHFLNQAIGRPRYPMPTLQDALHKLNNAKVFSVIDASDRFYQMELEEASADLTTFWSPLGRYRYRRVPQGISSAPEEYQMRQVQAYDGLRGVIVVADDTLVFGVGDTVEEAQQDLVSESKRTIRES